MTARARVILACAAVTLGGCSKDATAPIVTPPVPPSIVALHPVPRSVHVPYRPEVWARFDTPLDPESAVPTNVFLKLDTRRIPITVSLGDSNLTLRIQPLTDLDLRRTHTVEFTEHLRSASGVELGEPFFWQFTTTALRRVELPLPANDALDEGPLQVLSWRPTESSVGPVDYSVYAGTDSAEVAEERVTPWVVGEATLFPPARWTLGQRYYWKVHARHPETGDEEVGPVWSFVTLPPGTPIDSTIVNWRETGTWDQRVSRWRCPDLIAGFDYGPIVSFTFDALPPGMRVHDAYLLLRPTVTNVSHFPTVWRLGEPRRACDQTVTGIVPTGGFVAGGYLDENSSYRFASETMASLIQASLQGRTDLRDYTLRAERTVTFNVQVAGMGVKILYYVVPPTRPRW